MNADPKPIHPATDAEPTSTSSVVPMWLIGLTLLLVFWGLLSFDRNGGWFQARAYQPFQGLPENFQPPSGDGDSRAFGLAVYKKTCEACHQGHGKGTPGSFPTLHGTDWVLEPEPGRMIRLVLNGLQGPIIVKGESFNNAMVGWKTLSDEEIAAVITYVRQNKEWGNNAPAVTPERVREVREKIQDRNNAFTPEELLQISPAE